MYLLDVVPDHIIKWIPPAFLLQLDVYNYVLYSNLGQHKVIHILLLQLPLMLVC